MGFRRQSEGCKHCQLPEDCGNTADATCPSPQPHKVWRGCPASTTVTAGLACLLVGLRPRHPHPQQQQLGTEPCQLLPRQVGHLGKGSPA